MAKWASKNPNPNTKSGLDLMQNCDLPPPSKVFAGPDKSVLLSMNQVFNNVGVAGEEEGNDEVNGTGNEKLELLKALRLSQTRAREAEKKAAGLAKERDILRNALMADSLKLSTYRQWVKLLEFELVGVERARKKYEGFFCEEGECEGGGPGGGMGGWIVGWVVCLGVVGVGLAFGCRFKFNPFDLL